jgi:hypothetical protein
VYQQPLKKQERASADFGPRLVNWRERMLSERLRRAKEIRVHSNFKTGPGISLVM